MALPSLHHLSLLGFRLYLPTPNPYVCILFSRYRVSIFCCPNTPFLEGSILAVLRNYSLGSLGSLLEELKRSYRDWTQVSLMQGKRFTYCTIYCSSPKYSFYCHYSRFLKQRGRNGVKRNDLRRREERAMHPHIIPPGIPPLHKQPCYISF